MSEATEGERQEGRGPGWLAGVVADVTPLRISAPYRRLWLGTSVSVIGQQMTVVAVAIQVYAITQSSFHVGLIGAFALVPLVVFGLYGGAIADAVERRRLILITQVGLMLLSVVLFVQATAGTDSVWLLYVIIAFQSGFFAVNNPARNAIIPRLVGLDQLPAANALSQVTMNLGLTVGPLLGGVLIGATGGVRVAYGVDVVTYLVAVYAAWRLPPVPPLVAEGESPASARGRAGLASVLEGLRFLRTRTNLLMSFLVDIVAMVFGMPRALFPAVAGEFYGGGAGVVGLLSAAPAVGALLGALFSGRLPGVRWQGRAVLVAITVWGFAIAVFGLTSTLWVGLLLLAVAGCADMVSAVFRSTILQVATPDALRGRLQGVFVVVVAGGPRLGDVESGAVAALFGERVSIVSGGLLCVAGIGLLTALFPRFAHYDGRHPEP
ncbi:MAG TPA: MFS transporter [Actinomycetes bacterium]|nr:MFS transporter [Actinomycetes bacterium]